MRTIVVLCRIFLSNSVIIHEPTLFPWVDGSKSDHALQSKLTFDTGPCSTWVWRDVNCFTFEHVEAHRRWWWCSSWGLRTSVQYTSITATYTQHVSPCGTPDERTNQRTYVLFYPRCMQVHANIRWTTRMMKALTRPGMPDAPKNPPPKHSPPRSH